MALALPPALVYVGVTALFFSLQTRMIFPGSETQGRPEFVVKPPPDAELLNLEANGGEKVVALFGAAQGPDGRPLADAASRPTLLYFYGNGNCLKTALGEFERFRKLGVNVLIPDYLGYGMSGGKPGEAGCYATADAAYDHLLTRKDVDPKKIVAAGWSLGAAVAIDLAARRPVVGLVAFSAFTSMTEMGRRTMPWLPVRLLLRHRFASESKIARVKCPILIGHGRHDRLIPHEMSDRLAAAAGGPVTRFTIDHADHGEFYAVGDAEVTKALGEFLEGLAANP